MTTFQDPPPQSRRAVRQSERGETPQQPAATDQPATPYTFDAAAPDGASAPGGMPADAVTPPQTGRRAQQNRVPAPADARTSQPLSSSPPPAVPGETPEQTAFRVRDFSPEARRGADPSPTAGFAAPAAPIGFDQQHPTQNGAHVQGGAGLSLDDTLNHTLSRRELREMRAAAESEAPPLQVPASPLPEPIDTLLNSGPIDIPTLAPPPGQSQALAEAMAEFDLLTRSRREAEARARDAQVASLATPIQPQPPAAGHHASHAAPVEAVPVEAAPAEPLPAEPAPVELAPVEPMPVQQAPVQQAPAQPSAPQPPMQQLVQEQPSAPPPPIEQPIAYPPTASLASAPPPQASAPAPPMMPSAPQVPSLEQPPMLAAPSFDQPPQASAPSAPSAEEVPHRGRSPRAAGHWRVQAAIEDDELPYENTLSRTVGSNTSAITTSALVLPSVPQPDHLLNSLTATGEILVTGSIDLPRSLGSTGAHPSRVDNSDFEDDPLDSQVAAPDSAPIRAIRAISTNTSTRGVIETKRPQGNRMLTAVIVIASTLCVGLVTLLVVAFASGKL